MKRFFSVIILAALIAAAGTDAFAQFGVNVSYMNSNTWTRSNAGGEPAKMNTNGFAVGIDHNIRIVGNILSIQPGIYYQHLLKSEDIAEISGLAARDTYMENYLAVPVYLKVGFNILPKNILRLYVFAGPTFEVGLMASNRISVNGSLLGQNVDGEISYNYYSGKIKSSSEEFNSLAENYFQTDGQGQYGRFDIMLGGGVGLQVVRFLDIKVGYDYGLVNRLKGTLAENATANWGQFYVGVGIRL